MAETLTPTQSKKFSSQLEGAKSRIENLKTIFSKDLQSGKSFQLNQPKPNTESAGLLGTIDSFTQGVNDRAAAAAEKTASAFEQYLGRLTDSPTRSEIEATVYGAKGGVDDIQKELDDIGSQIMAEQHSLNRKLERLDENPEGLFGGALEDEKARVERDSLRKQADLSIIQMSIQGRFNSAETIANRLVEAEFEREEKITSAVKLNYEANKELFTIAEQRAFETNLGNRERKLTQEREDAKTLQQTKLNALKQAQANGAPSSVLVAIQSATTPEAVLSAGGKWASADLLAQQAQRATIAASNTSRLLSLAKAGDPNAIRSLGFDPRQQESVDLDATTKRQLENQLAGADNLTRLAKEYRDLIKDKGYTNSIFGSSATIGKIDTLRTQMVAAYKEAKTLGALDQGVLTLVDGIIGERPVSTFGIFTNATGRKSNQIVNALDTLITTTEAEKMDAATRLGYKPYQDAGVTFGLDQSANDEINKAFGVSNTSTAQFSPANYFPN